MLELFFGVFGSKVAAGGGYFSLRLVGIDKYVEFPKRLNFVLLIVELIQRRLLDLLILLGLNALAQGYFACDGRQTFIVEFRIIALPERDSVQALIGNWYPFLGI